MQSSSRFLIGWTAIEYGVIAIGTVLAIIAALQLVGTALS
jgi:Flp pilus assembly pilin Flp